MEMGNTLLFPCNNRSRLRVPLEALPSLKLLTGSRSFRQGTTSSTRVTGTRVVVSNTECEGRSQPHTPLANDKETALVTLPILSRCPLVCIYRLTFANADRGLVSRILSFEEHSLFLVSLSLSSYSAICLPFLLNTNRRVLFTNVKYITSPRTLTLASMPEVMDALKTG